MILGVIPARYASTRFPGKPLADIQGKSMIQRVYEQSAKSASLDRVIVATDDQRILDHVLAFGGEATMTSDTHPSGTDRSREVLSKIEEQVDYVINIQGDEPFIEPKQIDTLAAVLDGNTELATLIIPVSDHESLFDKGEVKVVLNDQQEALFFSRNVIPALKDVPEAEWHLRHPYYRHVGMYAYRADVLEKIAELPVSSLEKAESLEQLRWLEKGYKIKCAVTDVESYCVDTPEDLQKAIESLNAQ